MEILEILGLIIACAVADRLRGGWHIFPHPAHVAGSLSYGAILGLLLGVPPAWFPALALLWWLGEKPGWGYPMGQAILGKVQHAYAFPNAAPERWQFGFLKNYPWPSLIVRGLMWGLPTLAIWHWQPDVIALPFAMAVAMFNGALFDHMTGNRFKAGEFVRGAIMGLICATVGYG